MAASDLDMMMKQGEVAKDEFPQKVGYRNPKEAAWFIKDITNLTNTFMGDIQDYNHYKAQAVYKEYILNFHKKLVELDSTYFNKKAMRLMAQLIKFYKFYYLLYLNKRWLNSQ